MSNIAINELENSIELGRQALAEVTGGHGRRYYRKCRRYYRRWVRKNCYYPRRNWGYRFPRYC